MKLIIAEKPDLGRDIAKAIKGIGTECQGVIVKGNYTITWVFGHLLKLKDPERYNPDYAQWSLEQLPIYFPKWQVEPITDKAGRVKQIGELVKQADLIIHAGDPDDEGQLLIDELLRYYHYTGPVKRLDTGDTTTPALQRALENMRDNKPLETLGWSAYARSVSDFLVGINMSRFFTLTNHRKLTVGRVQTPTLGLVVNRDLQIECHKKIHHYELQPDVQFDGKVVKARFQFNKEDPALDDGRILDKSILLSLQEQLNEVTSQCRITKEKNSAEPPLPFNLVKLQSYCGKKWKYKPAEVMTITQSLREKYHAISYNRSDCQYLSNEHYRQAPSTVPTVLANLGLTDDNFDPARKSRCFNDANITAHFAIIPTGKQVDLTSMSEQERNVYQAIASFYLVQFLQPCIKEATSFEIPVSRGSIKAASSIVISAGYTAYLQDGEQEEFEKGESPVLSSIPEGDYTVEIHAGSIVEKETKPPARYTQSTLNEDMTRIAKYVKAPDVKKLLLEKDKDKKGENGSIGTSATRSMIISELIRKGFLIEEKGKLISTPVGREFYRVLPDELKLPDMTAKWYVLQEEIKNGQPPEILIDSVLNTINEVISNDHETIEIQADIVGHCPLCGQNVTDRSKGYFCNNQECRFVIWKEIAGKKITPATAEQLLSSGQTAVLKGFKSKTGNTFDASLKLNESGNEGQYVEFGFYNGKKPASQNGKSKQGNKSSTRKRRWS